MIYGEKLKYLREEKEISQYKMSEMLNLNKRVYGQYEREYINIPLKHLITLCDYFNVSLDYIFNFTDIKQYNNSHSNYDIELIKIRLKELRKENNLTQTKLSDYLNIDQPTWSIYEKGKSLIGLPFLHMLCTKFNVSADYLLGKIDNPKYLKNSK